MEKICPLRLGSESWFCSNLSLYFFCGDIEMVMITQALGNLPSDSEIWFWKSNREKSLGLSEHNFQLFPSSPQGVETPFRLKGSVSSWSDNGHIRVSCGLPLWAVLPPRSKKGCSSSWGKEQNYVLFTNRWSLKISLEKVMEEVTAAGLFEESQQSEFHLVSVSAVGSSPPS